MPFTLRGGGGGGGGRNESYEMKHHIQKGKDFIEKIFFNEYWVLFLGNKMGDFEEEGVVFDLVGRGLAFCGCVHFLSWLWQIVPLFGRKGIIPAGGYGGDLENEESVGVRRSSIWLFFGDWLLRMLCVGGVIICLGLVFDPSAFVFWVVCCFLFLFPFLFLISLVSFCFFFAKLTRIFV